MVAHLGMGLRFPRPEGDYHPSHQEGSHDGILWKAGGFYKRQDPVPGELALSRDGELIESAAVSLSTENAQPNC